MVINLLDKLNKMYDRKVQIENLVTKGNNSLDEQFKLLEEYRKIIDKEISIKKRLNNSRDVLHITL